MNKESKWYATKIIFFIKERSNRGNEEQKWYKTYRKKQRYILISNSFNINWLKSTMKEKDSRMDNKTCCLKETHLKSEDKVGWMWMEIKDIPCKLITKSAK